MATEKRVASGAQAGSLRAGLEHVERHADGSTRAARLFFAAASVLLWLSACSSGSSIRTFATASAVAVENADVASDYASVPIVIGRLAPDGQAPALVSMAKERAKQKTRILAAQRMLAHYFRVLGSLATGSLPDANAELGSLASAFEDAKGPLGAGSVTNETVEEAGAMVKVLTKWSLQGWQGVKVAEVVREADPAVQRVVAGLREIVEKDFAASLDQEEEAIRLHFESIQADAASRSEQGSAGKLARYLEFQALDAVEVKRRRLRPYSEALGKVGKGHAELAAAAGKLDEKGLVDRLAKLTKELETLVNAAGKVR